MSVFLLFSIFVIAVCGIVYELLAGTISSYLLGDSVYQFSLAIGIFMSSMGLGSFLSRYINDKLAEWFVLVELLVGVLGGLSSILLFVAFSRIDNYPPVFFLVCITIGTLVGLELPLTLRLLQKYSTLQVVVSNVMTADYIGALFASILFPVVLVPRLGLIKTSLFFGLMNVLVGALGIYVFRAEIERPRRYAFTSTAAIVLLTVCLIFSTQISSFAEDSLYKDDIVFTSNSPYQRIVITKGATDFRMFINGSIQFSSKDEYRYHESLVHPGMTAAGKRESVLVIGGGDGLAVREILKYAEVRKVVLVDIDPAVTEFARKNPLLKGLNEGALHNPKVTVVNQDAWKFLEGTSDLFDVILIDLPDPDDLALSRLYSRTFYRLVAKHLSGTGVIVTQATSPLFARQAFWCVKRTLESVESNVREGEFLKTKAYHAYVPSFGEWGFIIASQHMLNWSELRVPVKTAFLSEPVFQAMTVFSPDMEEVPVEINTIDTHPLRRYYDDGWEAWQK